ncbi:MAG: pirin family protein [Planctomycetes bacterium]|nr:pirin family protein [Planctomycetota bacterium]
MLRRAAERRHVKRGLHESWLTLFPQEHPGPVIDSFGFLVAFDEMRIPPGGGSDTNRCDEVEIITYVHSGALAQEDSTGGSGVLQTGEFQRMTTGRGIRRKEKNASRTDWVHTFRITLHPSEAGLEYAHEQKRFTMAQRRNVLFAVASRDGRKGSLCIPQDALIHSSILDPGHHIFHELMPGRSAWLHVVYGEVTLNEIVLTQGDGVGVANEPSVSLVVQEKTEILLVDLGSAPNSSGGRVFS